MPIDGNMRRIFRRWRRVPIRVRLTAFFAAGAALLLIVFGSLIYRHTAASLLSIVDTGLRYRTEILVADVQQHGAAQVDLSPTYIESDEAFAQVIDSSGRILQSSDIVSEGFLIAPEVAGSIDGPIVRVERVAGIDTPARVFAVPVDTPAGRFIVAAGSSLGDRDDALAQVTRTLLVGGPIALILLSLGGWFAIGAALRPVERMRAQAAGVSSSDALTRLPVPDGSDELSRLGVTLNGMLDRLHGSYTEIVGLNEGLEEKVRLRTLQVEQARNRIIESLSLAAEYRDDQTGKHTQRVGLTSGLIAERLGLDPFRVELIRRTAPLHDVGKIAIPDRVLLKPGKLTPEEYEEMKQHAQLGATLLGDEAYPLIETARTIAISHHERFDGRGYPSGVGGEAIPLEGRIVSVADVFDALTHERPYKEAWPLERALEEILGGSGTQFDPQVVEAFMAIVQAEALSHA